MPWDSNGDFFPTYTDDLGELDYAAEYRDPPDDGDEDEDDDFEDEDDDDEEDEEGD